MSAYADQEELEKLKSWWKEYGNSLIFGIALGAAILVGVRYWNQYTEQRLDQASVLYEQLLQEFNLKSKDAARKSGSKLVTEYASTPYAGLAGLILARLDFEAGDKSAARRQLQWVVDHAEDEAVAHAARLRLARLYFGDGEKDAALALLNVNGEGGFKSEYEELRGDIYLAQGEKNRARAAYREALGSLPPGSPYAQILNTKLDDLGPDKAP
ncbi:MAG TPA: tetratricopeptide repeat protein [Sulfuricaulis sp.]|nr:tetratricopeptide repeat protein [Sulfuricaulis sp.]